MQNKTFLSFLDDVYEDLELWYPKLRLEEAGYALKCAAPEIKTYAGKHGYPAASDLLLKDAHSEDFCGLLVPGGFMPDKLRRDAKVLSLTREFFEQGKLVAFICHGGWIPISAKILNGKRVTAPSYSVRIGDVVTLAFDHSVKVVRVEAVCERRGPATAARALYSEMATKA